MLGSDVLDIAVGLVLIYLLLSLIMTAVQEAVAAMLKSRAANLQRAVTELLQGDQSLVAAFYNPPLIYALHRGSRGVSAPGGEGPPAPAPAAAPAPGTAPAPAVAPAPAMPSSRPSYIPREIFAAVLIDLAKRGELKGELNQAYQGLSRFAGNDLVRLRREIEVWYDSAMDRAAGWYKRHTQLMLFLMGLAVALLLNVNSVTLAQYLAVNPQEREFANRLAEQVARSPSLPTEQSVRTYRNQLDAIRLPVGWSNAAVRELQQVFPAPPKNGPWGPLFYLGWVGALLSLLIGYGITALAITLGAPFWFDLLNRIMVIRSTVKPTEKSPDEPSEDGGRSRQPLPPTPPPAPASAAPPAAT